MTYSSLRAALTITLGVLLFCVARSEAYEADKASTPTLWKIANKAERVAADKKRRGQYYANRMEKFLNEDNSTTGGIVFLGDSITDRLPSDIAFKNGLHGKKVYNRGIGGDRIEGVLERLDVGIIDLQPSEIYVLIGGNDVAYPVDYKNGELKPGYERLFRTLKEVAPQAKIVAFTCPPATSDKFAALKRKSNAQLAEVCKAENIKLYDTFESLATPEGVYREGMYCDAAHLSMAGFFTWLELFLTTDEMFDVYRNLAEMYDECEGVTSPITGVNEPRKLDDLIMYRKVADSSTTTTGTNKYGMESIVIDETVTSCSSRGNIPLPELPGYVLSGIGTKRNWILANANEGAKIQLAADGKTVTSIKSDPKDAFGWHYLLRGMIVSKLAKTNDPTEIALLKGLAHELVAVRNGDLSKVKQLRAKIQSVDTKK